MDINTRESIDSMAVEVKIERYAFPVPRVWTGGLQIHSSPVSSPNAFDIWEYCSVSGHAARTVASTI